MRCIDIIWAIVLAVLFFFGIVGLFFAIGIGTIKGAEKRAKICTAETIGTVISVAAHKSREGHDPYREVTYYYPVFEYIVDGETYEVKPRIGDSQNKYFIGETEPVHYNPTNPKEATVLEKEDFKFGRSMVIFMIFFVGLWIVVLLGFGIFINFI